MIETEVLIVGAGPSGITAAIYLKRSNIKFVLLEKYMVGGKLSLTSSVDNYPGFNQIDGVNFAMKLQSQLDFNNIKITYDEILSITKEDNYFIAKGEETYKAKKVLIATGTKEKKLNLPNEEELIGKGVSFCAVCDGSLYKNKDVALVGGGNSCLEEALYLASIAKNVYIIHRRNEFRADALLVDKAKETSNIHFLTPYIVKEYKKDSRLLNGLIIENVEDKSIKELDVACAFLYIGLEPNTSFIEDEIEKENCFIKTDENMESSLKGLYALGDIRSKKLRQVVTATSDGAIAALAVQHALKN